MRIPAALSRLKRRLGVRAHLLVLVRTVRALGPRGATLWYRAHRTLKCAGQNTVISLESKDAAYPLLCRAGTSDRDAFRQVFIEKQYSCVGVPRGAEWVIDCGSNVGYSAAYFLSRFPQCRLIAVEPDSENVALLRRNLEPYGRRGRVLHAAVWSHSGSVAISEQPFRDGLQWSRHVRECRPGEATRLQAVDMATLLTETQGARVAILKMDVEGAEAVIFSSDCGQWLAQIDTLVIELHDDSAFGQASRIFANSIAGCGFSVVREGEVTICTRTGEGSLSKNG